MAMAEGGGSSIEYLPVEVLGVVLSFTSPRDVCRSAAVSAAFRAAASSDVAWERLLPPEYSEIVDASSVSFSSKKELYFRLCDSVLVDGGRKIFALDRATGKKRITLSARDLSVTWGDAPQYWRWISIPGSRFAESAELLDVCWLEIWGRVPVKLLSPKTTYAAYFVFKLSENSYGLDSPNQIVSIKAETTLSSEVCLDPRSINSDGSGFRRLLFRQRPTKTKIPHTRRDGWMEVSMGEFVNDDVDEVIASLLETEGGNWKRGLIVFGIELRPK